MIAFPLLDLGQDFINGLWPSMDLAVILMLACRNEGGEGLVATGDGDVLTFFGNPVQDFPQALTHFNGSNRGVHDYNMGYDSGYVNWI